MWKPTPPKDIAFKKESFRHAMKIASFIYQIGQSKALREPSQEVPVDQIVEKDTQAKIKYLTKCMLRYRKLTGIGRGIAGVQVGIPEKIIAVYNPDLPGNIMIIINPRVTKTAKELLKYPEICMSAQPAIAPTVRPAWIEFEYYDENGKKCVWNTKATDVSGKIFNRIFEHEIDHLNGYINIDRVNSRDIVYESDPNFYKSATFEEV